MTHKTKANRHICRVLCQKYFYFIWVARPPLSHFSRSPHTENNRSESHLWRLTAGASWSICPKLFCPNKMLEIQFEIFNVQPQWLISPMRVGYSNDNITTVWTFVFTTCLDQRTITVQQPFIVQNLCSPGKNVLNFCVTYSYLIYANDLFACKKETLQEYSLNPTMFWQVIRKTKIRDLVHPRL